LPSTHGEDNRPRFSQSFTLPEASLGMTNCQRNAPDFSSKHIRILRSPVCCGSRGFSLLVPTNTFPPETTTLPNACEPSCAVHFTFLVVAGSISSVPALGLPASKWSGKPVAVEYILRPGSLPPQRGQSAADE